MKYIYNINNILEPTSRKGLKKGFDIWKTLFDNSAKVSPKDNWESVFCIVYSCRKRFLLFIMLAGKVIGSWRQTNLKRNKMFIFQRKTNKEMNLGILGFSVLTSAVWKGYVSNIHYDNKEVLSLYGPFYNLCFARSKANRA